MRQCKNWLETYLDYTFLTEPPDNYHLWCGVSALAACLRRQVWIDMGFFNVYPNMYVVLVGPPATRKNTAINIATRLAFKLEDVRISADATTREALIKAIGSSKFQSILPNKDPYEHCSLTIISKELSVFLGSNNHDLLSLLTDLYDCHDKWEYRTKNMGIDTIHNEWLNLLGGTTPTWLVGSVPMDAIGGGFTSRVIFVVESTPRKRVALPVLTQKEKDLQVKLLVDLHNIALMCGEMVLTPEAKKWFTTWYEEGNIKASTDIRFDGYYGRKHIHLLKTAMMISASWSNNMVIAQEHLVNGLEMLEGLEGRMIEAFGAAGRNILAQDIDVVLKYIQEEGRLSRDQLLKSVWRDVNPKDIDIVLRTLQDMNHVKVMRDVTTGVVFYTSTEKEESK